MTQEILKYQAIDGELIKLEKELANMPERQKATEMQNQLKAGQNRLSVLEQNAQKTMDNFSKAKAYYNDLLLKIEALSKGIEGSSLEKIKELQKAKNNFYQMLEKLEKELSKISTQLNIVNNEYNSIIKNAKIAKTNLDNYKVKFADAKAKLEPRIEELNKELKLAAKNVDAGLLAKYLQKRETKFPVIVKNISGTCGGCRMAISASKMGEFTARGYIECENCGRFIVDQK